MSNGTAADWLQAAPEGRHRYVQHSISKGANFAAAVEEAKDDHERDEKGLPLKWTQVATADNAVDAANTACSRWNHKYGPKAQNPRPEPYRVVAREMIAAIEKFDILYLRSDDGVTQANAYAAIESFIAGRNDVWLIVDFAMQQLMPRFVEEVDRSHSRGQDVTLKRLGRTIIRCAWPRTWDLQELACIDVVCRGRVWGLSKFPASETPSMMFDLRGAIYVKEPERKDHADRT